MAKPRVLLHLYLVLLFTRAVGLFSLVNVPRLLQLLQRRNQLRDEVAGDCAHFRSCLPTSQAIYPSRGFLDDARHRGPSFVDKTSFRPFWLSSSIKCCCFDRDSDSRKIFFHFLAPSKINLAPEQSWLTDDIWLLMMMFVRLFRLENTKWRDHLWLFLLTGNSQVNYITNAKVNRIPRTMCSTGNINETKLHPSCLC